MEQIYIEHVYKQTTAELQKWGSGGRTKNWNTENPEKVIYLFGNWTWYHANLFQIFSRQGVILPLRSITTKKRGKVIHLQSRQRCICCTERVLPVPPPAFGDALKRPVLLELVDCKRSLERRTWRRNSSPKVSGTLKCRYCTLWGCFGYIPLHKP